LYSRPDNLDDDSDLKSDDENDSDDNIPVLFERDDDSESEGESDSESESGTTATPTKRRTVYDRQHSTIQGILRDPKHAKDAERDHIHFGDQMAKKDPGSCRIYFQNVNGLSTAHDWSDIQDNFHELQKREVDIFGFAETNVAWNPTLRNQVHQHGRGRFDQFKLVTASSDDPTTGTS
jgi:hypothetical protein